MDFDCGIVGAGPAGLHCGTYLGRYLRSAVMFDGGRPRASWIPITRNFPCFPAGVTGTSLLNCLREQALMYGAEVRAGKVNAVEGTDGEFVIRTEDSAVTVRKVILATGVWDIPPEIPNPERYKGLTIRHCPICDVYEARDRKMALFGHGNHAALETMWIAHFSRDLSLVTCGHSRDEIRPALLEQLSQAGIPVFEQEVTEIREKGDELGDVVLDDETVIEDVFRGYSLMGLKPNSELAANMGLELDQAGYIVVDADQQTSMKGVYAAGDIVSSDVAQVVVGLAHAAIATTHIHNRLRE